MRPFLLLLLIQVNISFARLGEKGTPGTVGECTKIPVENTTQGVFNKLATITNAALSNDGASVGDDGSNVKVFAISSDLKALKLANGKPAVLESYPGISDLNTFQAQAQIALQSAVKKPYGYANSSGFYTAESLKNWIKSRQASEVGAMIANKEFVGVYHLKTSKLQAQEKIALNATSHKDCSDLILIKNGASKTIKCLNYNSSNVTCESGMPTYACKYTKIQDKIGAYVQAQSVINVDVFPYEEWAAQLNQIFADENQDTNSAIQSGMIFYENSVGGISCAVKVGDVYENYASVATYNGSKYLKVSTAREDTFCKPLYRLAAFNPQYDSVNIITNLSSQTLAQLEGTEQAQSEPVKDSLTSFGFKPQFNQYINTLAKPYTLSHITMNFSGDALNTKFHLDAASQPVTVKALSDSCSTGGSF